MKKLLMGSVALLLFAISITLFQISCQKDSTAQQSNGNLSVTSGQSQIGKIIFTKGIINGSSEVRELWTSNLDGTNQQKISITLPSGFYNPGEYTISPDGTKIIFQARTTGSAEAGNLYTCNIDGSNVTRIIGNTTSNVIYWGITAY